METSKSDFAKEVADIRDSLRKLVPEKADTITVATRKEIRALLDQMNEKMFTMCGRLEILEKQLKEANEKIVAAAVREATSAQSAKSTPESPKAVKRNYASALKKNEIVVECGEEKLTALQLKNHVMSHVDPVGQGIGIDKITKLKSGAVRINCAKEEDLKVIKDHLKENANLKVRTNEPRRWMKFARIGANDSEEMFVETIHKQNQWVRAKYPDVTTMKREVKIRRHIRTGRESKIAVAEVSPDFRRLLAERPVYYKFESVWAEDYKDILQCYQCHGYGHRSGDCKVKVQVCGKCGESGHKFKECKSSTACCVVCTRFNTATKDARKVPTDHDAKSSRCPSRRKRLELLEESINY